MKSAIQTNLERIQHEIGNCKLVVVSKYRTVEELQTVYDCGYKIFAENRVQALLERVNELPKDIQWHLIGHLQTNKVKFIVPFIQLIQSVDSLKLLEEIQKQAEKINRKISVLLQVYISADETKFGLSPQELDELIEYIKNQPMSNIEIRGLMGMATFTDDENQIKQEFQLLKQLFDKIKLKGIFSQFDTLSMGMSSDYKIAVHEGANLVRVGSAIFTNPE